jgi:HAD superfamily hydrolase (TIGR01549 family)
MFDISNYDVYIFDCDGVILDSNKLKSEAFRDALAGEPRDKIDDLVDFHKINGGISRYEKFKYFYEVIHPSIDKEDECKKAILRFGKIVSERLKVVDCIPGVEDFLKSSKSLSKELYVNSGGDEKELRSLFTKRNLSEYFNKIYGSPDTKEKNLEKILNSYQESTRYLFFGDSKSDYLAAKAFNIDFVYISGVSEWQNPEGNFIFTTSNFIDLINS